MRIQKPAGKHTSYFIPALKATIIFIFLLLCFPCFSQTKKLTRKAFIKDSIYIMRLKIVRPQFKLDNRTIFFRGQTININGFDAGVLLKEKLRLTLGYYGTTSNSQLGKTTIEGKEFQREIVLKYVSVNLEFVYKKTRYYSLGMPLDFGIGGNTLNYSNSIGEFQMRKSGAILFTDFGLSASFKPIRWIGIKGIVGYRKTLFNQVKDFHLDAFFTSIGVFIDIREIVKDVQMFKLKKKYKRSKNSIETAVDLITD